MLVRTDPDGAQAQGHHLAHRADGHAGDRRPPAPHDGGHRRVLRGVLRRRARAGREPGRRRERRLARRERDAQLRARHRVRGRRAADAGAGARPRRAGQAAHEPRRDRAGTTPACVASSGTSPPSSTRSGRSPSATSRRRSAPASSAWVAACSSWPSPSCASGSATSPCACSTARRCRSTTSAGSDSARHVHGAVLGAVDDHRRGHVAGAAQHRRRAGARPAPGTVGPMDFELTDDQASLQEGMRAFVDGRFTLDDVRAIEADGAPSRPRAVAGAGRDGRVLAAPARGRRRPRARDVGGGAGVRGAGAGARARARSSPPARGATAPRRRPRPATAIVGLVERRRRAARRRAPADLDALLRAHRRRRPPHRTRGGRPATTRPARSTPLTPVRAVTGGLPAGRADSAAPTSRPRCGVDGMVLTAALQLGIAARTVELATEYAKEREQFGRADRLVPGDQAPHRRHARARRGGARRGVRRRLQRRRPQRRRLRSGALPWPR